MRGSEALDVRELRRACHPGWPDFPEAWHTAFPTLVMEVDGRLVGWTAFGVAPVGACDHIPTDSHVVYGRGVYVAPDARGRGYGRELHEARLAIGRAVGCTSFVGMTQPWNKPMIRLFERFGYRQYASAASAYPDGSEGLVYVGGIA